MVGKTRTCTICDCLLGNSGRILPIPTFKELNSTFAIRSAIHTEHAQVSDVDTELLNGAAPKGKNQQSIVGFRHLTQTDRKVSQAAIKTLSPFCINQKQTFDRLVLFPTPLTPTKAMV